MDPLDIIYNPSTNGLLIPSDMYLGDIAIILRLAGILACVIVMTWSGIKLLFIESPQEVAEQKAEISHRLVLIVFLGSIFWLMDLVKSLLDMFFLG